jgi:hypothetical protein
MSPSSSTTPPPPLSRKFSLNDCNRVAEAST